MKFDCSEFFEMLKQRGIPINDEQRQKINEKIDQVLSYEPKVGIFGKTGVGKSRLCNALFGQDIAEISDVESCTRTPQEILIGLGSKGMKLVDVPGVGENHERDQEYAKLYAKMLPELDLVLWLIKGDDKAFTSDETFYQNIVKPHLDDGKPFFVVINQVDKIEPFRQWDEENRKPGAKQEENIEKKVAHVSQFFSLPKSQVIPVSAAEQYNLVHLIEQIVFALPNEKKMPFVSKVTEENVSATSRATAKEGFFQAIWQFIKEKVLCMDDFVTKAAALGLPAIMLVIVMATTGLAGAAAITAALATLGGPAGMLGGIALLGIIGLATEMLSKYGLEALLIAIYRQRIQNGESRSRLCGEIRNLPISRELKRRLDDEFGC